MSKHVENKINEIVTLVNTLKAAGEDPKNVSKYEELREELNMLLVLTLVGAEVTEKKFGKKKGQLKVRFNKPLPSMEEVAEIANVVQDLVMNTEVNVNEDAIVVPMKRDFDPDEFKMKNKDLEDKILGNNGFAFSDELLTADDIPRLAAIGMAARKRANIVKFAVVAGAIVITVTTAAVIYNSKKNKKDEVPEETDTDSDDGIIDMDEDIDDVEVDDVDIDDVAV